MNTTKQFRRTTVGAEAWVPCVTSSGRTIGEAE